MSLKEIKYIFELLYTALQNEVRLLKAYMFLYNVMKPNKILIFGFMVIKITLKEEVGCLFRKKV